MQGAASREGVAEDRADTRREKPGAGADRGHHDQARGPRSDAGAGAGRGIAEDHRVRGWNLHHALVEIRSDVRTGCVVVRRLREGPVPLGAVFASDDDVGLPVPDTVREVVAESVRLRSGVEDGRVGWCAGQREIPERSVANVGRRSDLINQP